MTKILLKSLFHSAATICVLFLGCIPEDKGVDNTFEIRPAKIYKITTTQNDTLAQGDAGAAGLWYKSGSEDCHEYYDSSFVRTDSVFYAEVREKIFTRRLCIETSITRIQSILLPNGLPAGSYKIIANAGSVDSLVYRFWVQ